jgi:autotransporter-associated beta strand protein
MATIAGGGEMRGYLLTTTVAVALLSAMPAHAQDATWSSNPFTATYDLFFNWTPAAVPTGTASFGATNTPDLNILTSTTVGGWTFNAGAPAYTFTLSPIAAVRFVGAGIVNGGSATIFNNDIVSFENSSTAGNATIINILPTSLIEFSGSANAGNATITSAPALSSVLFRDTSGAGNATINVLGGSLEFRDFSSAESAVINNTVSALTFSGAATAGNATINNNLGNVLFTTFSSAGNATITNNIGILSFIDSSSAGSAAITNNGALNFFNASTAGNANITNNSLLLFFNQSTAGNANVRTTAGATTLFFNDASGGRARFINDAGGSLNIAFAAGPVTVGSIEGAGNFALGANQLTTGGNNLSTTVSGGIDGFGGSLVKTGSGTLTLSGINSYTGPTIVDAGALIVDGSIAPSSLTTVQAGALLGGNGTVGSTIIAAGGTLVPGVPGVPGTMTVAGNLAFQSGAAYLVQINPTASSTTNVSGTAALAGTVQANFLPGSFIQRSYTILSAGGGSTGTFDALTTVGLPANFRASLSYTGNTAVLNLQSQLVPPNPPGPPSPPGPPTPIPPPVTFTVNQLNVGNAIDDFFNNGGRLPASFVPLFGLTGNNLARALDQLSGEAATGAQRVGFQLTDQFLNLMLDPFVDGRSGVGGADHPALGFAPQRDSMPPEIALAYASVLKAPQKALPPIYEPRWTAWGGAYGGSNRTSGDLAVIGSHDVSARAVGVAGGLDYRLTPDTVVGFAFAGGGTDWSLSQGLGGGKSDAFQAGVYGATRSGPAYVAAAFAFTNHWMSTDRFSFAGDHLTAKFNAQSIGGRLEGGYRLGWMFGGITPYAAIQAQSFRTPDYNETDLNGGGFGLGFAGRTATDTRTELGARFDNQMLLYPGAVLALRARLAWAHDWVTDPVLGAVFQTLPGASFIVNGATPAQNSALASAGGELRLANGVSLLGKFDGGFSSHSTTYGGTGTVRYRW